MQRGPLVWSVGNSWEGGGGQFRGGGVGEHGGESPTSSTSLGEVQSKRNVEADGLDVKPQEPS